MTEEEKTRLLRSLSCSPKTRRKGNSSASFDNETIQTSFVAVSPSIVDDFVNVPLDTPTDEYHESRASATSSQDRRNTTVSSRSKPGFVKSLLKRANSAPKKLTILRRKNPSSAAAQTQPPTYKQQEALASPTHVTCCHPFVDKLKTMADKQLNKVTHKRSIKRVDLENGDEIVLEERQPILELRESPKADRRVLASYVEKRDSDEIMEILELDESPSEVRKRREQSLNRQQETDEVDDVPRVVPPPKLTADLKLIEDDGKEPSIAELLEEEFKNDPPQKASRREKDHVYEDIENPDEKVTNKTETGETKVKSEEQPVETEEEAKKFRIAAEVSVVDENEDDDVNLNEKNEAIVEEIPFVKIAVGEQPATELTTIAEQISLASASVIPLLTATLAKDETEFSCLSAVTEVSEPSSESALEASIVGSAADADEKSPEFKSSFKSREASLGPDKRVTFSASTEEREAAIEAELREREDATAKEDVCLPSHIAINSRWSNMR